MPQYIATGSFLRDLRRLSAKEFQEFLEARDIFVECLLSWEANGMKGRPVFPKKLGVKPMTDQMGIMELAWAPDGRATWEFGAKRVPEKCLVIWRRIGDHTIYGDP